MLPKKRRMIGSATSLATRSKEARALPPSEVYRPTRSMYTFSRRGLVAHEMGHVAPVLLLRELSGSLSRLLLQRQSTRVGSAVVTRDAHGHSIHGSGFLVNDLPPHLRSRLHIGDTLTVGGQRYKVRSPPSKARFVPGEKSHVIIVPSMRPQHLHRLIGSIMENVKLFEYNGRIKVVVIDDSDSSESNNNRRQLRRFEERGQGQFSFHYYSKKDQQRLVEFLKRRLPSGVSPDEAVFAKTGQREYGGLRNVASLLALRHIDKKDIVTFLDDDVSFKNLVIEPNGRLCPRHVQSYFHALDSAFSNRDVKIVGGEYTGDEGGAAFDQLNSGLDYVQHFFSHAKNAKPSESAARVLGPMWVAAPHNVRTVHTSFSRATAMMSNLFDQLSRGRFRFTLGLFPHGRRMEHHEYHVAGNLSMRADVLEALPFPVLGNRARGEDVFWTSTYDKLNSGGVYYLPNPVLHRKGVDGRRIMFDVVRDMPCHVLIDAYRNHLAGRRLPNISPEQVAALLGGHRDRFRQMVGSWDEKSKEVDRVLADGWWNSSDLRVHADRIRDITRSVREGIPGALSQIDENLDAKKISESLNGFAHLAGNWARICRVAREFK